MSLFDSASLVVTPNGVKAGKLYSIKPTDGSGDLSVTRATSATRVDANGLVEIPRTNLLLRSEEFDNASWTKSRLNISANSIIAPDGNLTADLLDTNANGSGSSVTQNVSTTAGLRYNISVFAKKNNVDFLMFNIVNSAFTNGVRVWFNLATKSISTTVNVGVGLNVSNTLVEEYDNDWLKLSLSVIADDSLLRTVFVVTNTSGVFSSVIGDKVYLWGAQLQEGVSATEYIPTTSLIRTKFAGITQDGGSASNIPRIDYTNGSCPSILVEPQRTNLVRFSEQFDNAIWVKSTGVTVTANVDISPDGTMNADRIIFTDVNQFVTQFNILSAVAHYGSVYVKGTLGQTIRFTVGGTEATRTLTGEWQRIELLRATAPSNGNFTISTFANVTARDILIWGAQLEAGSNATSYIPTVASSVTRNADVISKTGISSFFGTNKGTIFCDFIASKIDTTSQYVFDLSDGVNSGTNRFAFYKIAAGTYELYTNTATGVTINTNTRNKVAITWNGSTVKIYANGVLKSTITYANANPTKINLGSRFNNLEIGNVNYNLVTAFATDLTNDECINLTTI